MTSFINYDTVVDLTTIAPISEVPIYDVNKIQGIEVTDNIPSDGDILVYNGVTERFELGQPVIVNPDSPIFNANALQGKDLPAILPGPSINDILVYNGSAYEYQAVLDPTDNIFNANALQGKALPNEDPVPSVNDTLVYNGVEYEYQPYLDPDSNIYNAKEIQDFGVTTDAPTDGDMLVFNGTIYVLRSPSDPLYNANKIQGVVVTTDTPNDGDTLVYNNISSEYEVQTSLDVGVNTVQNLTNKSFQDSTTYFYDELDTSKRLQFDCSEINGTKTLTVPDTSDIIVVLAANQTLTNKTFTRPVISSESKPVGSTGMIYHDSTLNLPAFFNGVFWQYIGMCIPVSVTTSAGTFYAIPVVTAIGDLGTLEGATNNIWPTNNWSAFNGGTNTLFASGGGTLSFAGSAVQFNYIEYDFGIQQTGVYSIIFNLTSRTLTGIITVTEQTTGIEIFKGDLFRPVSTAPMITQFEYPFIFNGDGVEDKLVIRWASNEKNSDVTASYGVRLGSYIQLTRIG